MSKYQIRVPLNIPREKARLAIKMEAYITISDTHPDFKQIPDDWKEEIKDEPVSVDLKARNWHNEHIHNFIVQRGAVISAYKAGHAEGEKIEKSSHQPQQTFKEWAKRTRPNIDTARKTDARMIWNDCEKNRGY